MKALLEAKHDPNTVDATGSTPLHTAARTGDKKLCKCLLRAGADLTATNSEGLRPAAVSAASGHESLAAYLESKSPCSTGRRQQFEKRSTVVPSTLQGIMRSARHGRVEEVRVALQSGFNPCSATQEGLTLLHVAAQNGQTDVAEELLRARADPNATAVSLTRRGRKCRWAPLDFATRFRYQGIVRLLHAAGATPTDASRALDDPVPERPGAITHRDARNLKPLSFQERLTLEGVLGLTPRGLHPPATAR